MQELIERAKLGDRAALEQLLSEVAPSVHRFGLRMCRNASDAQDVAQDTLLSIVDHLAQYEGRASLTSWVFTLARTACARRRRGLKNQPPAAVDALSESRSMCASPEFETEQRQIGRLVMTALDDLPAEQREVIALRDIEGLSADEAAAAIGIAVPALKSRLHRARAALRSRLEPMLEPASPPGRSDCPDVARMFSRNLEGELSKVDCAQMEAHVASCPHCGAACHALRDVLRVCQSERGHAPSPAAQQAVRRALARLGPAIS